MDVAGILTSTPKRINNVQKQGDAASSKGLGSQKVSVALIFLSVSLSECTGTTSGETVLHQAAALCHRTICHYLVEAGASLMKTDMQVALNHAHALGH